ncbi:MAG TPA: hypothetical protein VH540_03160 [Ktedonobacterales bacterium]|jgi:hypothetical protein
MNRLSRRKFLWIGGTGVVAVAAGGVALVRQLSKTSGNGPTLSFQAVAGLPRPPLNSYASYAVAGQVDLGKGTGTLTRTVYAGPPESMLPVALLARQVRVTSAKQQGNSYHITGVIDDRAQLQSGESASVDLVIDASSHAAHTDFFGDAIQLQVQQLKTA